MRNYKSWLAFMTFLGAYIYALIDDKSEPIIYTTGFFLIVITIAMMIRSETLNKIATGLVDILKEKVK